jgi:hypothetical protein
MSHAAVIFPQLMRVAELFQAGSKKVFRAYKQGRPDRERPDIRCDYLPLLDDRNPVLVFRFLGGTWLRRELQYGCLLALA